MHVGHVTAAKVSVNTAQLHEARRVRGWTVGQRAYPSTDKLSVWLAAHKLVCAVCTS